MIFWKNNRQKANKIKNYSTYKKEYVRMQNGTERRLNKCSIFLFSSSNTCNTNHFFQCPQENKKITFKFITGDAIPLTLLSTHNESLGFGADHHDAGVKMPDDGVCNAHRNRLSIANR